MNRVAVVLAGCGVYDGAEVNEAVLTLLCLEQQGASYECFAPDIQQLHVINHLTGEPVEGESRNVLVEAARIARGNIRDLGQLKVADFDALLVPGGFGAAKNLSNFAVAGSAMEVQPDFLQLARLAPFTGGNQGDGRRTSAVPGVGGACRRGAQAGDDTRLYAGWQGIGSVRRYQRLCERGIGTGLMLWVICGMSISSSVPMARCIPVSRGICRAACYSITATWWAALATHGGAVR